MSVEKDVRDLKVLMRSIEQIVLKGTMPDCPVLYERDDGSEDIERFVADYNCTPDEAYGRGATYIVVRTNFNNPNLNLDLGPWRPMRHEFFPAERRTATVPTEGPADVVLQSTTDPLVEALVSQARDKAQCMDTARRGNTEK